MSYLPISAFGRSMTLAQLQEAEALARPSPQSLPQVNKWSLLRALVKAREAFGLKERDLTLLQGLLSFYPKDDLAVGPELVIFPSNRTICERMNGMADSTMRRHLRKLLSSGLLLRRDSSNGKRFAIRNDLSSEAYGFDLTPLFARAAEIFAAANAAELQSRELAALRRDMQLIRRDIYAILPFLDDPTASTTKEYWDNTTLMLRRKLDLDSLRALYADHLNLLDGLKSRFLNSSDSQIEQHIQNSNINTYESEPLAKTEEPAAAPAKSTDLTLPLEIVLKACPSLEAFHGSEIREPRDLTHAVAKLYKALGISEQLYLEAEQHMGREQTAVVIAALLQRFEKIRSPGAYLRSLVIKAANGAFSCKPMIMALLTPPRMAT